MKKSLIAASASAVALAAMPVVSTFAAVQSKVTDTVQLTVQKTCQMEATSAAATYNLGEAVAGSEYAAVPGTPMTLTCNSVKGWTLKATATALSDSADTKTTSQTIPFGAYPGTITAGTTASVWSAKIAITGTDAANASVASTWGDFSATVANNTTIASSVADSTGAKAVNGITVTPSYKAYAQANQAAATYSGTIEYTFAENQ